MELNRSSQLKHKPRGIIKWAPFNSLPEFTMQLKEQKNKSNKDVCGEKNDKKDY